MGAARLRPYMAGFAAALVLLCAAPAQTPDKEAVGRHAGGRVVTPVNQLITPAGKQIELPGMCAHGLALSPDGRLLIVSGLTSELLVLDPATGTKGNVPTPAAMVADNDLAVGRVIEGLSHSLFWKDLAVFAIEDDPQNGYDHVTGYRTTAYVAGPHQQLRSNRDQHRRRRAAEQRTRNADGRSFRSTDR
jgi:hypothetical protein